MGRTGHEMYTSSAGRDWLLKHFHGGRLADFASFVGEPGGTCLSVGCGTGIFEEEYLSDAFEEIHAIDPVRRKAEAADGEAVTAIQASSPPMPFKPESFDCVVAAGAVEHLPDERGFLEGASESLKPGGELYLTVPIEVGLGGFFRHLGRCYTDPAVSVVPDGKRRYIDYSLAELFKRVPRDKHTGKHRYYNYTYLLDDLRDHEVHAAAHVTGGGWTNLDRMGEHRYEITDSYDAQRVFEFVQEEGNVSDEEMHRTFNMGTGFVAALPPAEAESLTEVTDGRIIGEVTDGDGVAIRGLNLR